MNAFETLRLLPADSTGLCGLDKTKVTYEENLVLIYVGAAS